MTSSFWVIIPSAGKGSRFGSSIPKQYQPFLDSSVLQYTINRFVRRADVAGVVVVVAAEDEHFQKFPKNPLIHQVEGGWERADSVFNALRYLRPLVNDDDLIAVHDAARPCVRASSLDRLFAVAGTATAGAILAQPAIDTVKLVQSGHIEKTIDRSQVWLAQTPQVFPYGILLAALQQARDGGIQVTDEAAAVELSGLKPAVVTGNSENIKITAAGDLGLASFFMNKILREQD